MKSLDQLKDETAEELGYYSYQEFEIELKQGSLDGHEIKEFIELYATNRVKEVENYYKTQDNYEEQSHI